MTDSDRPPMLFRNLEPRTAPPHWPPLLSPGQSLFLHAVEAHAAWALDELRTQVLPAFREAVLAPDRPQPPDAPGEEELRSL